MSSKNITRVVPTVEGTYVTFATRNGDSITYRFSNAEGAAIASGADPKDFQGERVDGPPMGEIGELATEIGEIAELGEIL